MARPRTETALDTLRQQQIELAKRIAAAAAAARERAKQDEQRRRAIAGAAALEHMAAEPQGPFAATLLGLINRYARSAADRALFNLPPLRKEPTDPVTQPTNGGANAYPNSGSDSRPVET
jgi:hypothetical protein